VASNGQNQKVNPGVSRPPSGGQNLGVSQPSGQNPGVNQKNKKIQNFIFNLYYINI
jgi:hypothetical protein